MLSRSLPIAVALALAGPAGAEPRLLDEPLRLAVASPAPDLRALAVAAEEQPAGEPRQPEGEAGAKKPAPAPGMDFDLLGEPEKPPPPSTDARAMRLRTKMLKVHQGVGVGLLALQLATTTVGQLNYSDKFAGGPNTNRYKDAHKFLAYVDLGVFVANGTIALLAPEPPGMQSSGFDRVMLHKVSMFTAAAGMAAQGVLGVYTARREGFQNQERLATAHLAIGYATLAAMLVGVSAIVF